MHGPGFGAPPVPGQRCRHKQIVKVLWPQQSACLTSQKGDAGPEIAVLSMEGHRDLCFWTRAPEYQISPMDAQWGLCLAKLHVNLAQGAGSKMPDKAR